MTLVSYAQNFEDVLLWRALRDVENGTYIDVGAQDPVVDSVSLAFYTAGWRGIHVEPAPFYAAQLREARPDETVIEAAVTDAPGPIDFYEIPKTGLSTGRKEIAQGHGSAGYAFRKLAVPTVRLESLFERVEGEIHWLKIDVEGMESDVLRSWGESPRRPWILVIEATAPSTQVQTHTAWIDEVVKRGYEEAYFDGLSRFFVHKNHAALAERLAIPANVFDAFSVSHDHFSAGGLRSDMDSLRQRLQEEQGRATELHANLTDAQRALEEELGKHRDALQQLAANESAHRTALEQQRARENELQSDLRQLHEDRNYALEQHQEALRKLTVAERERRLAIEAGLREFQDSERELRSDFDRREEELRAEVRQATLDLSSAREELARVTERSEQLRSLLTQSDEKARLTAEQAARSAHEVAQLKERAEQLQSQLAKSDEQARQSSERADKSAQEAVELRSSLEAARASFEERLAEVRAQAVAAESQLRQELGNEVERYRSMSARADALIRAAISERPGRWQRLGQAFGLARQGSARRALEDWSLNPSNSQFPSGTDQQAMNAMHPIQSTPQPLRGNPYLRADSLANLLAWHDVDFVRCAYVTVLGRQPDPDGEAHYTRRIRDGRSKREMLWELRRSPEGRLHDPGIAGFDRALKRAALGRTPLIGAIVRLFTKTESDSRAERRWRSLVNSVEYLRELQERHVGRIIAQVDQLRSLQPNPPSPSAEGEPAAQLNGQLARVPAVPLSDRARDIFAAMAKVH